MYKVIIIDDEPVIVRGLSQTIPWEKHNCQVVGTAFNGKDGLDLIRDQKPDILISDICMPGMDGLTMIASIKSQFPKMQICILTGFRDFDYAQRAICLGVTRFLLKPSKMNELLDALDVMTTNLSSSDVEIKKEELLISDTEQQDSPEENTASSFIVKNALQYIDENYQQKIMLSEVAEHIYVSQWHLSKLLHRHTGQNFSEILNNVRIEKAKELLNNPALRIGEVAEKVGFVDMAHFSRVFKKIVGISANEFRNTVLSK
ncbi:response regulator transcription factor [Lachnoclostridium phytofermentans]|uniref:Stage 0 sporulation protein A homolog n=1 Tax=Lachnoclostridium phytofermentans (strain ATCC 700394 / DSM 18823 / ISDg) TaxID=357809 RepID=A9KL59_LACP7|nr:response regulator [Lachnoclostridium phytofermentans]ABX44208.1 two component transcriptional regulator, AraC family [Lachnoclostridium phytofermentans ISDg]